MQGDLLNSSMKDLRGEVHFTFSKCSKALRIDYKLKKKKRKSLLEYILLINNTLKCVILEGEYFPCHFRCLLLCASVRSISFSPVLVQQYEEFEHAFSA